MKNPIPILAILNLVLTTQLFAQFGVLDVTFGSSGKSTCSFRTGDDRATSVAIQPDGKIIAAGRLFNGTNYTFALVRYNTSGMLDNSFSTDGQLNTTFSTGNDGANSVAIQSDGKIVAAGYSTYFANDREFSLARYNSDGTLDVSFSGDGKLTTSIGPKSAANSVAIQPNGKIVVAGYSSTSTTDEDFALARYNSDGTLDNSFDTDGLLTISLGSGNDRANSVAIQSNGKIVVAGYSNSGSSTVIALARYNPDGTLDTSFDSDGKTTSAIGTAANSVVIQPDGKIVLAVSAILGTNDVFALARFNMDGSLDNSFSNDGIVTTDFGVGESSAMAVTLLSDGKIIATGESKNATYYNFSLARYNTDGSLDIGFNSDGKVTTAIGTNNDFAASVAIKPDGQVVAAGYSFNGLDYDFALAQYNPDGTLDNTFNTDGKLSTNLGRSGDVASSIAIQPDGKIVVGGYIIAAVSSDFALLRYLPNGSLDNSFSNDGKVTTAFSTATSGANAVALQPDGKIIMAGHSAQGTNVDFALARYNVDGNLDNSFGIDGKITTAIGVSYDRAYSLALQQDGKIVVAGHSYNGVIYSFALARYNKDGTLDNTFSTDGKLTTAIGTSHAESTSVAIQDDGKIIAAGFSYSGSNRNFALVRYNSDGTLDNTFGINGEANTDFSGNEDKINSLALQSDGKIAVAGFTNNAMDRDFALARYISGLEVGVLDFPILNNSIFVYPNPVKENAILEYTLTCQEEISIDLLDFQGNKINNFVENLRQDIGPHQQKIILPDALSPGCYFIVISSARGKVSIKVIK